MLFRKVLALSRRPGRVVPRVIFAGLVVTVGSGLVVPSAQAGGLCHKRVLLVPTESRTVVREVAPAERVVIREVVRVAAPLPTTQAPEKKEVTPQPQMPAPAPTRETTAPAPVTERVVVREVAPVTERVVVREVEPVAVRATSATVRTVRAAPADVILVKPKHCWKW